MGGSASLKNRIHNGSGLGEIGDYEAQNFLTALQLIPSTNVELTTEQPLSVSLVTGYLTFFRHKIVVTFL